MFTLVFREYQKSFAMLDKYLSKFRFFINIFIILMPTEIPF